MQTFYTDEVVRSFMKKLVKKWMIDNHQDYVDLATNSINLTELAEGAAYMFKHDEWLDDPDHWIWDLPIEISDKFGFDV